MDWRPQTFGSNLSDQDSAFEGWPDLESIVSESRKRQAKEAEEADYLRTFSKASTGSRSLVSGTDNSVVSCPSLCSRATTTDTAAELHEEDSFPCLLPAEQIEVKGSLSHRSLSDQYIVNDTTLSQLQCPEIRLFEPNTLLEGVPPVYLDNADDSKLQPCVKLRDLSSSTLYPYKKYSTKGSECGSLTGNGDVVVSTHDFYLYSRVKDNNFLAVGSRNNENENGDTGRYTTTTGGGVADKDDSDDEVDGDAQSDIYEDEDDDNMSSCSCCTAPRPSLSPLSALADTPTRHPSTTYIFSPGSSASPSSHLDRSFAPLSLVRHTFHPNGSTNSEYPTLQNHGATPSSSSPSSNSTSTSTPSTSTPSTSTPTGYSTGDQQLVAPANRNGRPRDNDDEPDGNDRSQKRIRHEAVHVRGRHPNVRYACPFQKHDTEGFSSCSLPSGKNSKGGFPTFHRVRQHMFMAHCSSMRCKRCWKLLKKSELSAHEAQKSCRKKPCPYPYQITDLRHIRAIRFQGEDFDKWYILYEALFPNVPKQLLPKTPYYDFPLRRPLIPAEEVDVASPSCAIQDVLVPMVLEQTAENNTSTLNEQTILASTTTPWEVGEPNLAFSQNSTFMPATSSALDTFFNFPGAPLFDSTTCLPTKPGHFPPNLAVPPDQRDAALHKQHTELKMLRKRMRQSMSQLQQLEDLLDDSYFSSIGSSVPHSKVEEFVEQAKKVKSALEGHVT